MIGYERVRNPQEEQYTELYNNSFKSIDLPIDLQKRCDEFCNNSQHNIIIDKLYYDITSSLCLAASSAYCDKSFRKMCVPGWNKHVSAAHGEAKAKFMLWESYSCPRSGPIYKDMVQARRVFKG